MIRIPAALARQFPINPKYATLDALYREYEGLPLPLSNKVVQEGLDFVDAVVASPVFDDEYKDEAKALRTQLMEHADDWSKMKLDTGSASPLYRVLLSMQEELQSLRTSLNAAQSRLDAYDEARLNHARRVLGLPPARSRPGTPPNGHAVQPMYSNPSAVNRLSADRLRDALEVYLDETPPLMASREQLVRALRVCCGMEEEHS